MGEPGWQHTEETDFPMNRSPKTVRTARRLGNRRYSRLGSRRYKIHGHNAGLKNVEASHESETGKFQRAAGWQPTISRQVGSSLRYEETSLLMDFYNVAVA